MAKRKWGYKFLFALIVIILVLLSITALPFFSLTEVLVSGNEALEKEYVMNTAGIKPGDNIFYLNSAKAEKNLLKNPYVREAEIKKFFPNKVEIVMEERKVRGYIETPNLDSYLLIDEEGRLLDIMQTMPKKLPVIVGIILEGGYSKGELLNVRNSTEFETVAALSQLFSKYELNDDIVKIDVTESTDIHIYVDNIDFLFGSIDGADEKVRRIRAIIPELEEGTRGQLDIKDLNKAPLFKYLT